MQLCPEGFLDTSSRKKHFSRGTGFVSSANGHPSELGHGEERWRDAEIHVLFLSYYLQVRVDELSYRWLLSLHTDLKACGCVCLWFLASVFMLRAVTLGL